MKVGNTGVVKMNIFVEYQSRNSYQKKKDVKYNTIYLKHGEERSKERMGSNLNDNQLNIDFYLQKVLYTSQMVTINKKKLLLNMQGIKRKESKYITKENQQAIKQIRQERIGEKLQK